MKILVCFLLICQSFTHLLAQNTTAEGVIYSSIDSLPLEYVQISLKHSGIGTISNKAGEYQLYIKDEYLNDTIIFQHIAYKQHNTTVKDLLQAEHNKLYMQIAVHELSEVNIVSQDSLRDIVEMAVKRIRKNYPNHLHCMSAYFRQTTFDEKTNKASSLIETALDIQDRGNNSSMENIKFRMNEMRRSDDPNEYSFVSNMLGKLFGKNNEVYNILERNPIRGSSDNRNNDKIMGSIRRIIGEDIDFYLQKTINKKDRSIWVISYDNPKPIQVLFKESGTLYINSTDYAFEKIYIETSINEEYSKRLEDFPPITYEINYKKIEDRYFLSHIIKKGPHDARNRAIQEKLLLINQHYLKRKEFDKIRNRFKESRGVSLKNRDYKYNPEFWKEYNIVKKEPLAIKVIKELEHKVKLSNQFKKNANN